MTGEERALMKGEKERPIVLWKLAIPAMIGMLIIAIDKMVDAFLLDS